MHDSAWYIPLTSLITMFATPKIALSLTLTGLSFCFSITTSALAATVQFDLSFFDENITQVGNGQFSYDDEISTCLELSPAGVCEPNDPLFGLLDAIIVTNILTDVSATIEGKNWILGGISWWSDDSSGQLASSLLFSRTGTYLRENNLFFQDPLEVPFFSTGSLELYVANSSDTKGEGNWQLSFFDQNSPDGFKSSSGTWQARRLAEPPSSSLEKVPEPSTIVGSLIAIGLGYYCRRKSTKHLR